MELSRTTNLKEACHQQVISEQVTIVMDWWWWLFSTMLLRERMLNTSEFCDILQSEREDQWQVEFWVQSSPFLFLSLHHRWSNWWECFHDQCCIVQMDLLKSPEIHSVEEVQLMTEWWLAENELEVLINLMNFLTRERFSRETVFLSSVEKEEDDQENRLKDFMIPQILVSSRIDFPLSR